MREVSESFLSCSMALGVALHARTKKKRLIFDARHLNCFLRKEKFKMESLHAEGRALFEDCVAGGIVDISSAYHHISMHESAWPYLGFSWKGVFYCFTVLPFGICSAPRVFTKVMKTCNTFMRQILGLRFINYLDDFPFAYHSAADALVKGNLMANTLAEFGWLIHPSKCTGLIEALALFECLGHTIDLIRQRFLLPLSRISTILEAVLDLRKRTNASAGKVARVKGLLASTWLALGAHSRIRTRSLDRVIASRLRVAENPADRKTWRRAVTISKDASAELDWFQKYLSTLGMEGRPFREAAIEMELDGTAATDASETGFGGWIACNRGDRRSTLIHNICAQSTKAISCREATRAATAGLEISGSLPRSLVGTSSALREIYGAFKLVQLFHTIMKGGRFKLLMDNIA